MTAEKTDEIKDLSKAFKNVCDIDHDDNFMEQLAEMPKSSKDVTIQPILQVDDDGFCAICGGNNIQEGFHDKRRSYTEIL